MSMTFPGYLALTAAEFHQKQPLPDKLAWMACHYSCYGTGLSNCPDSLPPGTVLMVNDRTPPHGHDPHYIAQQLTQLADKLQIAAIVLDLQRPDLEENAQLVQTLTQALTCPVAVSELYARGHACPVFLPPVPPHKPLQAYLAPWQDRKIWLEAALSCICFTVSAEGSQLSAVSEPPGEHPNIFQNEALHCHYCMDEEKDCARFTLWRTAEDLVALLQEAQQLGVRQSVGLYQELGKYFS